MNMNVEALLSLPWWVYAAAALVLVVIVAVIVLAVLRARFSRRLVECVGAGKEKMAAFRARYSDSTLLRRSRVIEKIAARTPDYAELPHRAGVTHLWVQRLSRRQRAGDFRRVLAFGGGEDLWPCF
ncbi:MAG TPA: hypothetical protein VMC79_15200, partial [Rectinemataceae bacterium]|nr:hypothetical protein [Rectinemataceae bacterium]